MKHFLAALLVALTVRSHASSLDDGAHSRSISAQTLVADYAKNPVAADEKHRGKVYTVQGKIERIVSDEAIYVELEVPGSAAQRGVYYLRCLFANTAGLAALQSGKTISVSGTVDGMRGSRVMLRDCVLPH